MSDWASESITRADFWLMFLWWQVTVFSARRGIEFPRELRVSTDLHAILCSIRDELMKKPGTRKGPGPQA